MKIKCDICGEEYNARDVEDIVDHYVDSGWNDDDMTMHHARVIFKIHEKIEVYNKMANGVYKGADREGCAFVTQILKSLLENEK